MNGDVPMVADESDCDAGVSVRPLTDGGSSSPGAQRRKRLCKLRDSLKCRDNVDLDHANADAADNMYADNLPEVRRRSSYPFLSRYTTFTPVRFKPRFSAIMQIFLLWPKAAVLLRKVTEALRFDFGQCGSFAVFTVYSLPRRTAA